MGKVQEIPLDVLKEWHSSRDNPYTSPAIPARRRSSRLGFLVTCKRYWKFAAVTIAYWLLWTSFALYVISKQ